MKSNYELSKTKGLCLLMLDANGGAGYIKTKDIPHSSIVWGRNEHGSGNDTSGYEHVSIAPLDGHTPTWDEMAAVKDAFFNDDEECAQIMPKKNEHVNIKENCLHIWRRRDGASY